MTITQFATFKNLFQVMILSAKLAFSRFSYILYSILATLFLFTTLYSVIIFFHQFIAVVIAATVILFYITSLIWLSIYSQVFCQFHFHLNLGFKQSLTKVFSYRYKFCGALLAVYGFSFVASQVIAPLAYFVFIAFIMSVAYTMSGVGFTASLKKSCRLAWQYLIELIVAFSPPIVCLVLSLFFYNYIILDVTGYNVFFVLLAMCIIAAIVIIWLFCTAIILQNKLDPDSVDRRLIDLLNKEIKEGIND